MKILFFTFFYLATIQIFAQQNSIFIANDDHTDYMWSGNEAQYRQAFVEMLDFHLQEIQNTLNNPLPFQSRFNCDGNFWLWEYERAKTPAEFQNLIDKVRSGHISVPYNSLVLLPGAAPTEAVLRGMYYAGDLQRRFNIPIEIASAQENQTFPYGLPFLWAGAGAKYSWRSVCGCNSAAFGDFSSLYSRPHEIYYHSGIGDKRILTKWYAFKPNSFSQELGGYAEAWEPTRAVDQCNQLCNSPIYPYNIAGAFGRGWDNLKTFDNTFVTVAQQNTDATKQVIVSNELDFFKAFENQFAAQTPNLACTFGNDWDVAVASLAEVSAQVKRDLEKLRAAEAMAVLVARHEPQFMDNLKSKKDSAWMAIGLYFEHDFVGDGPEVTNQQRIDWQKKISAYVSDYVNTLYERARTKLSQMIGGVNRNNRFMVFNPLGWQRSEYAEILYSGPFTTIRVVDVQTGLEVPSQVTNFGFAKLISIIADNVASVGYKVYEIQNAPASAYNNPVQINGQTIENEFYRIQFNRSGAISSLIDKSDNNREYIRNIGNRTVNDLGGAATTGTFSIDINGPVFTIVKATSSSPIAHTTYLILYRNSKRIELYNEITQNFGNTTQTWSFSFDLPNAELTTEEVGAVIKVDYLANGGHYYPQHGRYDWQTLHHFADMHNQERGVRLSNADCYFMKFGNSTSSNLDTQTPQIQVLAGARIFGMPNQGGDSFFTQRFAMESYQGEYSASKSMRFALEHQNPLITSWLSSTSSNIYAQNEFSLLESPNQEVLLFALKPAEQTSDEVTLRFWNFSEQDQQFTTTFSDPIIQAKKATHIEVPTEDIPSSLNTLSLAIAPLDIQTFQVKLNSRDSQQEVLAFNTGGPSFLATSNNINYQADQYFTNGQVYNVTASINNTDDDQLYQSERYGANLNYAIPLENGNYKVTLKFAEIYFNAPAQRVFDVRVENILWIDNLDIFSLVGKNASYDYSQNIQIADNILNIDMSASINNAKISAILIEPVSTVQNTQAATFITNSFRVYPNPANTTLTVDHYPDSSSRVKIKLFNLFSEVIVEHEIQGTLQLDISKLAPGVYYLHCIEEGQTTHRRKIIIHR